MRDVWDLERARSEGVGRCRLQGRSFVRVTPGAYLPVDRAQDLLSRCRALQHVRPDCVASHWTAVSLLGLPLPPGRRGGPLHALVGPAARPLRRAGVVGHRSGSDFLVVEVGGVRVTDARRTWCDLGRDGAAVPELVAVADAMVRAAPGLLSRLQEAALAGNGHRGVRNARTALSLVDPRAESVMESWVRVLLVVAGVPRPVPQLVVRDEVGRFVARVDLAWPESRLVVEYDGAQHRDRRSWVRDLRRREELERLGWTVVVLTAEDVLKHPRTAVERVRARLRRP